MKKVCGFYVSNIHLITMILPYLRNKISNGINIETFFEYNLNENINKLLSNLIINEKDREKILNINWKNKKIKNYLNIENNLKNKIENNKDTTILVSGTKKYIEKVNIILNKYNKNNVTIINCYEVTEFDDNIKDIINSHKYILNTSGIHKIEDVFENCKKKIVN